jgi:hypothetical protein
VARRRAELVAETQLTLAAIQALAEPGEGESIRQAADPLTDPATLARAVSRGVLDAPHLRNNPYGRGEIVAGDDGRGAWVALDPQTGRPLPEAERLARLGISLA